MSGGPDNKRNRINAARKALAAAHERNPESIARFNARMARLSAGRRHQESSSKRWCILRTSARSTIALTEALERDGYDVWTPMHVIERRIRTRRAKVESIHPIMASFVFADAAIVGDLFRLAADPTTNHPSFSVFHFGDRIPIISDISLAKLREVEEEAVTRQEDRARRRRIEQDRDARRLARKNVEPLPVGQAVRIAEGPFGGMTGIIERSNGRKTILVFDGRQVEVETFLLRSDVIDIVAPQIGNAA